MNRRLYAIHRWLSLLVVIQLLLWSVSGLVFATIPKEDLHGSPAKGAHDAAFVLSATGTSSSPTPNALTVPELGRRAEELGVGSIRRIELRGTVTPGLEGGVAIIFGSIRRTRLDLRTGAEHLVDEDEAKTIARRDLPGAPAIVETVRIADPAHAPIEYRGKATPAWRVLVADGHETAIYVDATSGDVVTRRNNTWRAYDFLWSLHIMAYRDREDFRHPLLIGFAGLAVLTSLSGTTLWAMRLIRALRSRKARKVRAIGL